MDVVEAVELVTHQAKQALRVFFLRDEAIRHKRSLATPRAPAPSAAASTATPRAGAGASSPTLRRAANRPTSNARPPRRLPLLACQAEFVGGRGGAAASTAAGGAQGAGRGGGAAPPAAAATSAASASAEPEAGEPAADGGPLARDAIPVAEGTPSVPKQVRRARRWGDRNSTERAGRAKTRAARASGRSDADS